jgi:hypothetical protein
VRAPKPAPSARGTLPTLSPSSPGAGGLGHQLLHHVKSANWCQTVGYPSRGGVPLPLSRPLVFGVPPPTPFATRSRSRAGVLDHRNCFQVQLATWHSWNPPTGVKAYRASFAADPPRPSSVQFANWCQHRWTSKPPGPSRSGRARRPASTRPLQAPGLAGHLMGVWNTQIEPRSG